MLRTEPTGLGILTGCPGREMLHGEAYEAELTCLQVDPANRQGNSTAVQITAIRTSSYIAAMLPGPQAITEELHAVHADGLCAGAGFFQVDAG